VGIYSDEEREPILEFAKKHKVNYPIVNSEKAVEAYGVEALPTKYVLAPSGKIALVDPGHLTGEMIEKLLQEQKPAAPEPPGLDYSPRFAAALAALRAGDYKGATPEIEKLAKDAGPDQENAKKLLSWIDEQAKARLAEGAAFEASGDVFSARDAYRKVEKAWGGSSAKAASEKLAALEKSSKAALAQEKVFLEAKAAEKDDKAKAAALYSKCAEGCPGTKLAELCQAKAKELSK